MKSPNAENINEWIFSYLEGDLSPQEESVIEAFLLDHPEYDQLLEAWGAARIVAEPVSFPEKSLLQKPLVSWSFVQQASVFAAIAINAVLASLIVFGPSKVSTNYDYVQLDPIGFNESGLENKDAKENIFINKSFAQNFSFANPNYNFISSNQPQGTLVDNPNEEQTYYNSSTSLSHQVSSSNANARDLGDTGSALNQTSSHARNSATRFDGVNLKKLPRLYIQLNLNRSIALATTKNLKFTWDKSENGPSKLQSLTDNFQMMNNPKGNRNNQNQNKFSLVLSRFAETPAFLTNSRRQEYLVPGSNRNQINFAHVGSDFSNSVYSNTYLQFAGKENQLVASQLGADFFVEEIKTGLGVQMMYNTYGNGAIRDIEASITVSPKIILGRNAVLEPAVRLRMSSTGVNRNELGIGNWVEFDRNNSFHYTESQFNAFVNRSIQQDFGLGVLLNTKWAYLGLNVDNMLGSVNQALHYKSSLDASRAPMFVNAIAGTEYESLNKDTRWAGHIVYQNHGALNKLWFGTRVNYKFLSLGAAVSTLGEPVFSFGMMAPNLSVLYSTDYAHSFMYNQKFWNHQLMLRLTIKESRIKKMLLN